MTRCERNRCCATGLEPRPRRRVRERHPHDGERPRRDLGSRLAQLGPRPQGLQTHSTGGLVATTGTSIIRSLYIDNDSHNPKASGTLQFVDNVVYNWVVSGYILGDTAGRSDGYMVGNSSPAPRRTVARSTALRRNTTSLRAAISTTMTGTAPSTDARSARGDFGSVTWQATPAVPFPEVPALMAQEALEYVATQAGTSIFRDAADDYVVGELRSFGARGATISDETSLGLPNGVGDLPTAATPADVDRDGMADAWERASGLDPIRRQRSQRRS